jgi:hypothetical protein
MLQRNRLPKGVIEATRDPWGRVVVLPEKSMGHIARNHRELDGCELAIITAVENASARCRSKRPGREELFAPNLGPTAWLRVIVAYDGHRGHVITAYGCKDGPEDSERI